MIAIVNYDTGNIRSVANALARVGCTDWVYTDDKHLLTIADKVILPGVGEASTAMAKLAERGLDTLIPTLTQPVLGICVGTQLMCQSSEEGNAECMGIFRTKVRKFQPEKQQDGQLSIVNCTLSIEKVPHMGWNQITNLRTPLFNHIGEVMDVYHSFGTSVECELFQKYLQQRPAAHGDKRLGKRVGEGFKTGSQSRRKNHGFHIIE